MTLDEMAARIRSLPELVKEAAPACADAMGKQLKASAAAGQAPDGSAWKPTKKGGRALAGAAGHIDVTAQGTVLVATLRGHDVFHQRGTVKVPKREIIPTKGLPAPVKTAIDAELAKAFRKHMGVA